MGNETSRSSAAQMFGGIQGNIGQTLGKYYRNGKEENPNGSSLKKCQFNEEQPLTPGQICGKRAQFYNVKNLLQHTFWVRFVTASYAQTVRFIAKSHFNDPT